MCKVAYILLPYRSRIYVLFKAIFFLFYQKKKNQMVRNHRSVINIT
nr:MAG TPA: hypothetical protein [Caudoviricetes sp.]